MPSKEIVPFAEDYEIPNDSDEDDPSATSTDQLDEKEEDVDIGCTTPVLNDDYWESHHPNSPMFTPLQKIPQSLVQTEEIHMGSDEPQASLLTIPEEIPATSADVNAAEEKKTQAATEVETEIPQPMAPEIVIQEAVETLTDTSQPKPKNPFSKKRKFKPDDFFHEHVFFSDYNPYDSAHL